MVCFDVFYDVVSFDGYLFIHWSGLVLFIIIVRVCVCVFVYK